MRAIIISFPGSNRALDAQYALEGAGFSCTIIPSHSFDSLLDADVILLPGGFSYGDYLRCGAIAARLAIMQQLHKAAKAGITIVGVCNGFQILTEAGLLDGALRMNAKQLFICRSTKLVVSQNQTRFTHQYTSGQELDIPIAHHEGNYLADVETIKRLNGEGQVVFRYAKDDNPNGSVDNIAGIVNKKGNVLGMMPHPENATLPHHAQQDGCGLFDSIARFISQGGSI